MIDTDKNDIPDSLEIPLAKKFNPCMVFTGDYFWPVDHSYLWARGGDLKRRVYRKEKGKLKFIREEKVLSGSLLSTTDWSQYPPSKTVQNSRGRSKYIYKYFIDGPGENRGHQAHEMTWHKEFEALQGGSLLNPSSRPFPPTQYVHYFWKDKAQNLLVVQYWFYYPYNKFINSHEGDWEHIDIILQLKGKGSTRFDPQTPNQIPLSYRFFFHGHPLVTKKVVRIRDIAGTGGDHVVVFVGGESKLPLPDYSKKTGYVKFFPLSVRWWGGRHSGGSFPWVGKYRIQQFWKFKIYEKVDQFSRHLHANEFDIKILPEPHQINYQKHPELSWLNLPFRSGNWFDPWNALPLRMDGAHKAPIQPAKKGSWNQKTYSQSWSGHKDSSFKKFTPPPHWPIISNPKP